MITAFSTGIIMMFLHLIMANNILLKEDFHHHKIESQDQYTNQYYFKDTTIQLLDGLSYQEWTPSTKSVHTATYPFVIVKIEQSMFRFGMTLLGYNTGKNWLQNEEYIAVVNAGMFANGNLPNGYTVLNGEIRQPNKPKLYNHYISIDQNGKLHIYDPYCEELPSEWHTVTQTIRMYRCDNTVVWSKQPNKQWSTTCLATDENDNVYFVHSRSAYMVNTMVHLLKQAIPELRTVSYLEGGPEATLSISVGEFEKHFCGSYESDFFEDDTNQKQWEIPNVIGIILK